MLPRQLPATFFLRRCAAALALGLGACGGGSGDAGSTTGGGVQQPSSAGPGVQAQADCGLSNMAADMLQRINAHRAAGASCGSTGSFAPTQALVWNTQIEGAAVAHSSDMASLDFHDHTGSDGSTVSVRVDATGYAWSRVGENIAAGYSSVDAVMNAWMGSAGHCANLMSPHLRDVAVACVRNDAGQFQTYWTMVLATPR
jgi:uncharacterized protein YkwD